MLLIVEGCVFAFTNLRNLQKKPKIFSKYEVN